MLTQEELDELLLKLDEQFENLRQRYIGKYILKQLGASSDNSDLRGLSVVRRQSLSS